MRKFPKWTPSLLLIGVAHAEPRPVHGSIGIGSVFLATGEQGDRNRLEAEVDLEPGGALDRYGFSLALRTFDRHHAGLLTAGLVFEAAAARPRLVIDLHVDAGADLDASRPVAGAGVRTVLGIIGPLAVAFDAGLYVVIAGSQDTRFALTGDALVVARW
jgi:hypothetical protein